MTFDVDVWYPTQAKFVGQDYRSKFKIIGASEETTSLVDAVLTVNMYAAGGLYE